MADRIGFGSPEDYCCDAHAPMHQRTWCPWCGACLHCDGDKECPKGTDGLHYWPPREGVDRG